MPRSNPKNSSNTRTFTSNNTKTITTAKSTPTTTSSISIQSQKQSIIGSVKDGIASGFGWEVGTSITRSIFGGVSNQNNNSTINNTNDATPITKCFTETENYKKCTEKFGIDFCETELNFLNKCKETIN